MSDPLANASAFLLLLVITAYSTAGGVDFGAGIWDLFAGRGPQPPTLELRSWCRARW